MFLESLLNYGGIWAHSGFRTNRANCFSFLSCLACGSSCDPTSFCRRLYCKIVLTRKKIYLKEIFLKNLTSRAPGFSKVFENANFKRAFTEENCIGNFLLFFEIFFVKEGSGLEK